jgi:mono/diheme cytochrome c family protein
MARPLATLGIALTAALGAAGCGSKPISLSESDPDYQGAVLFAARCGGCHTLSAAGTHGSATRVRDVERTDGPSFNTRKEDFERVLFAIRNGGFSGAIMPQNIVVGREAEAVARFVAKYSGRRGTGPTG